MGHSATNAIFDLDGTLVDSAPGIDLAAQAAWKEVRPGTPCPPMRPLMGPPIREMFQRALPGADPQVLTALERGFREAYDGGAWRKAVVFPGVEKTLSDLAARGVRCFGVTNKPSLPTQRILAHCGLAQFFQDFLSPDSRVPRFPSKIATTRALLDEYRMDPAASWLIGDTLEDANAALICGLKFLAFTGGYGWTELSAQQPGVPAFDRFSALLDWFTANKMSKHVL